MVTNSYTLSFIISTKNRLPFLKILFDHLLPQITPTDEIVVVDGGSTDGACDYLQQLFDAGKIHQYISEPDKNQAHGWNKALLMAQGLMIKKLIDDDVHHIGAIRRCQNLMQNNPDIDICISHQLESNLASFANIDKSGRLDNFNQWRKGQVNAFSFSDVTMLVRKSSLSYLGLYDVQFRMIDWEYALRVSALKAGIAYYTGYNAMSVGTPGNVTSTSTKKILIREGNIGKIKYGYPGDNADISLFSKVKIAIGTLRYQLLHKKIDGAAQLILPAEDELQHVYASFYKALNQYNAAGEFEFISHAKAR